VGRTQPLDSSVLDRTLQELTSRIERLQRERDQFKDELNRLRKRTTDTHTTINRKETHIKSVEENLGDMEEGKR